jgi:hypothetical protein
VTPRPVLRTAQCGGQVGQYVLHLTGGGPGSERVVDEHVELVGERMHTGIWHGRTGEAVMGAGQVREPLQRRPGLRDPIRVPPGGDVPGPHPAK